jgi:hypothetical protein
MCGSTEIIPGTDERRVVYFCSTYKSGKSSGQTVKCGAYRITHEDAERLLLDKINELKLQQDEIASAVSHKSLRHAIVNTDIAHLQNAEQEDRLIADGVAALIAYYKSNYQPSANKLERFQQFAQMQYDRTPYRDKKLFDEFRHIVREAEADSVKRAKAKLVKLDKAHTALTSDWLGATNQMREKLTLQAKTLESEMEVWKERTKPISASLKEISKEGTALAEKYSSLLHEWPALELREKGESLRRLFKTVTLYWDATFKPRSKKPSRPLKTNRKGRNSFTLLKDKIRWEFSSPKLDGSV